MKTPIDQKLNVPLCLWEPHKKQMIRHILKYYTEFPKDECTVFPRSVRMRRFKRDLLVKRDRKLAKKSSDVWLWRQLTLIALRLARYFCMMEYRRWIRLKDEMKVQMTAFRPHKSHKNLLSKVEAIEPVTIQVTLTTIEKAEEIQFSALESSQTCDGVLFLAPRPDQ